MGVSLLGLVSFQLYWINNAIKVSEERFKQDVHEALNIVVAKLEKQEALFTIQNSFETSLDLSVLDSISLDTLEFIERKSKHQVIREAGDLEQLVADSDITWSIDEPAFDLEIKRIKTKADSLKEKGRLESKSEMVTLVLDQLLTGKRKLTNRLDPDQLDSLLHLEFTNKGIYLNYDYGVLEQDTDTLIYANQTANQIKLARTDLRVTLFPNDIIGNINYLLVHFPSQRGYLVKKIWITLATAVLLILIIVACFTYAIMTILKQKKLSEIKSDFINNMTHEFKTPISTVSLACEALQDQQVSGQSDLLQRYLKVIGEENKRLGRQVEKVLQIASLEKEDFKLKMEQVNVHQTISKALENISLQVDKKGGQVTTDLKARQPMIEADDHHLTNIIYNLLDNATKYTTKHPRINITTLDTAKGILIRIIDNGIGMTKEVMQRIFDKFYRKPTGNLHDVKGFGLGLVYVKTMVEAHGGRIEVKSELDKGSIFEIFLPHNHE